MTVTERDARGVEGLEIRPARLEDLEALNDLYNHYVRTSHVTFDVEPTTIEQRRWWFDERSGGRYRVVVAVDGSRVAGYASSGRYRARPGYDTTVETSVYVAQTHVGRGVGGALYSALFAALEGEDLHRAVAGIALPNDASVALHRRFGFERVARFSEQGRKFGRYWDVDWYQRPLG